MLGDRGLTLLTALIAPYIKPSILRPNEAFTLPIGRGSLMSIFSNGGEGLQHNEAGESPAGKGSLPRQLGVPLADSLILLRPR